MSSLGIFFFDNVEISINLRVKWVIDTCFYILPFFTKIFSNLETVAPSYTAAVLEGLETGGVYTFRVYSENAAGMSDALQGPKAVRIQPGIGNSLFINTYSFLSSICKPSLSWFRIWSLEKLVTLIKAESSCMKKTIIYNLDYILRK